MAAATFTLLKSTPYTATYLIAGDGTGDAGTLDYSNAPTYAALRPGPYKTQIRKWLGSLGVLNVDDATPGTAFRKRRIRVYRVAGQAAAEGDPSGAYTLQWVANGLQAVGIANDGGALNVVIEIRLIHSSRR